MKKIIASLLLACSCIWAQAQDGYSINNYDVHIRVNKDASLDIKETISVHFDISSHGIYRMIPYKYKLQPLKNGAEKADRQFESGGFTRVFIEDINVKGWKYKTSNVNGYKEIKIGDKNKYVDGDQEYVITYKVLNAINFFKDRSEFYYNLIGDKWNANIDKVNFQIELYNSLTEEPAYFIASGYSGSRENNTRAGWESNSVLSGATTKSLEPNEGVTVGIKFPKDFLVKQNYQLRGIKWLLFPLIALVAMFFIWKKWGKDDHITITTEFYPPAGISPSVCGYVIDDRMDRRDLTALIPYWGASGYIKVADKDKDFEFTKVKELPATAANYEQTLFNGIFASGDVVKLSSLKNVLYTSMNTAKTQLESEVDNKAYYIKGTRGAAGFLSLLGLVLIGYGIYKMIKTWGDVPIWFSLSFILSGIITIIFGSRMTKKTKKGNELFMKLAGFKEFITKVEKPRLATFLKDDPGYFDTVLPFAIVFDVADKWKDKLKDMDIPPPTWYAGSYTGFNTTMFLNSLDRSMNKFSESFYSQPSSSGGSSGGSWSSGGGFSSGGFGGGGGGRW